MISDGPKALVFTVQKTGHWVFSGQSTCVAALWVEAHAMFANSWRYLHALSRLPLPPHEGVIWGAERMCCHVGASADSTRGFWVCVLLLVAGEA